MNQKSTRFENPSKLKKIDFDFVIHARNPKFLRLKRSKLLRKQLVEQGTKVEGFCTNY